jgi:hypothetical protein
MEHGEMENLYKITTLPKVILTPQKFKIQDTLELSQNILE